MVLHPFHRLGAGAVALEQDTPDRGEQRGLAELIRTAEHVEPVSECEMRTRRSNLRKFASSRDRSFIRCAPRAAGRERKVVAAPRRPDRAGISRVLGHSRQALGRDADEARVFDHFEVGGGSSTRSAASSMRSALSALPTPGGSLLERLARSRATARPRRGARPARCSGPDRGRAAGFPTRRCRSVRAGSRARAAR